MVPLCDAEPDVDQIVAGYDAGCTKHCGVEQKLISRGKGTVMKVLLINPKFPDTYWSFSHALPFEGKRSAFPPLGLLTVSALLPFSWERRLVDMNVESLKASHIDWADMIFITAMLVQKDSLRQVAQLCKAKGILAVLQ